MAKDKQKKQKERERRVAKKKLADVAARREREKTSQEPQSPGPVPERVKFLKGAIPQVDFVPLQKKSSVNQRRGK